MRMLEKTTIGRVVDCGPDTKLASTTSSKDKTNESIHPLIIADDIDGIVMAKNTLIGVAPKSKAASSMEESISVSLD